MRRVNLSDQIKYWGEKPAAWVIAGGLLVLAFLLFVIAALASETHESVYHDYAASEAQADAENIFDRECAKRTTIGDVLNCAKEAVKTARETQRSEEDVYAQKQMAQWAFWLLFLTGFIGVVSIAITGVGTYFLLRTVGLSGEANADARDVFLSSHHPILELRQINIDMTAWVDVDKECRKGEVWLANVGETDACVEYATMVFYIGSNPPPSRPFDKAPKANDFVTYEPPLKLIKAGGSYWWKFNGIGPQLSGAPIEDFFAPNCEANFYAMGRIRFRDKRGVMRHVVFCRRYCRKTRRFLREEDYDYEYHS